MANGHAQFLRLYDAVGTRARWQSYWTGAVSWEGSTWSYQPFAADDILEGAAAAGRSETVRMPAAAAAVTTADAALTSGWLAELRIYRFDATTALTGPPATMTMVGQFYGQAIGATATATTFTLELGSALQPVGATVPPRVLTQAIMGVGCRL